MIIKYILFAIILSMSTHHYEHHSYLLQSETVNVVRNIWYLMQWIEHVVTSHEVLKPQINSEWKKLVLLLYNINSAYTYKMELNIWIM